MKSTKYASRPSRNQSRYCPTHRFSCWLPFAHKGALDSDPPPPLFSVQALHAEQATTRVRADNLRMRREELLAQLLAVEDSWHGPRRHGLI